MTGKPGRAVNEADTQVCISVRLPSLSLVPREWDVRATSEELMNGVDRPLLGATQKPRPEFGQQSSVRTPPGRRSIRKRKQDDPKPPRRT